MVYPHQREISFLRTWSLDRLVRQLLHWQFERLRQSYQTSPNDGLSSIDSHGWTIQPGPSAFSVGSAAKTTAESITLLHIRCIVLDAHSACLVGGGGGGSGCLSQAINHCVIGERQLAHVFVSSLSIIVIVKVERKIHPVRDNS
jgi:hypothetical protein